MLLFDWNKIMRVSKGNVDDIIQILRIITYKIQPKNYYDKTFKFYKYKFGGSSYILNPKDLLERGRAYSDREVVEYAGVASFRNYHNYVNTKDTTLDFLMSPISEGIINNNRLLELKDGRVHFMFEETLGE
tara:strand:- start:736 stop:1128 length:393 start_codon:yes stop_codon:yes gene_type:complete